jgi:hypothetical protein
LLCCREREERRSGKKGWEKEEGASPPRRTKRTGEPSGF